MPLRFGLAAFLVTLCACSKKPAGDVPAPQGPNAALVAEEERSSHFAAVSSHLELGGTLYGYADVDGDALDLASSLQSLAHQLASAQPQLAPLDRQDFKALFTELGLADVKAVGFSSVKETGGMYRNRTFLYTPSGRHGFLAVLGGAPHRFSSAHLAPADTDYYMESEFDLKALYDTVYKVASRTAGPKAANALEASLKAAGGQSGFSVLDLIRGLKGRATIIVRFDPTETLELKAGTHAVSIPSFSGLVSVEGIGGALEPGLAQSGSFTYAKAGPLHVYTPRSAPPVNGITPVIVVEGKTLFVTTSVDFLNECQHRKEGLDTNPEFASGVASLGPEGNGVTWVSQRFFSKIRDLGALNQQAVPEQKRVFDALALNVPIVQQPLISVRSNLPDGILIRSSWNRSLKGDLAMITLYNPITVGLVAAMAIPAFQKVKQASQDKTVTNNLAILYGAAEQYYQANGVATVTFDQLVGPGKLVGSMAPVMGEDYSTLQFQKGQALELRLPDGTVQRYPPGWAEPGVPSVPLQPNPQKPPDERSKMLQQIAVLNNLYTLDAAAKKYYLQNNVDTVAYADLVGPGRLLAQMVPVAGEDYTALVFSKGQRVEVKLSDGRIIKYPLGNLPKPQAPAPAQAQQKPAVQQQGPMDAQSLAVVENLRILYEAADKFYAANDTTNTTYEQLVGPGKLVASVTPVAGEDYRPLLFKKDHPLRLYLKDGRVFTYPSQQAAP